MNGGVAWQDYLRFFEWNRTQQAPLGATEREQVERLAADILQLSEEDRKLVWGVADPAAGHPGGAARSFPVCRF